MALGASTPQGLSLCAVGWWDQRDIAATLVAVAPGRPVLWYNRRLVSGPTLQVMELWARRNLRDGATFSIVTADEIETLIPSVSFGC